VKFRGDGGGALSGLDCANISVIEDGAVQIVPTLLKLDI
jgi:hypothetical protein